MLQVLIVLAFAVETTSSLKWFGPNNSLQCHCRAENYCDDRTCLECEHMWIGPQCQEVSLIDRWPSEFPISSLNRRDACQDLINEGLNLNASVTTYIFWLLLQFDRPEEIKSAPSKIRLYKLFKNPDGVQESKQEIDVYHHKIDTTRIVVKPKKIERINFTAYNTLVLGGFPKKTMTCSLVISAGRNLALKQKTKDSKSGSDLVVSGVREKAEWKNCYKLKASQDWSLRLQFPASINGYVLGFDNTDCEPELMIKASDATGAVIFSNSLKIEKTQRVIQNILPVNQPISGFSVSMDTSHGANQKAGYGCHVELCEVQLIGEWQCANGKFGHHCEHTCAPCKTGECGHTWGCNGGCRIGYAGHWCEDCDPRLYGPYCSRQCSPNCYYDKCDRHTGDCVNGCKPGFMPHKCTKECDGHLFGVNCSDKCGECRETNEGTRVCHVITGNCTNGCKLGYHPPYCMKTSHLIYQVFVGILMVCGLVSLSTLLVCSIITLNKSRKHNRYSVDVTDLSDTGFTSSKRFSSAQYERKWFKDIFGSSFGSDMAVSTNIDTGLREMDYATTSTVSSSDHDSDVKSRSRIIFAGGPVDLETARSADDL